MVAVTVVGFGVTSIIRIGEVVDAGEGLVSWVVELESGPGDPHDSAKCRLGEADARS
jgi:hypothetical protein